MNKVILKTALLTFAAVLVAALTVFSLWILISPQTMADACEKTGNYSFAVTCADLRYKYTKKTADLARCAEDSILCGKDAYIITYGEMLTSDEGFVNLCTAKDETISGTEYANLTSGYNTYICGHLAAAQYRGGDLERAVNAAKKGGIGAFNKLVIEIAERGDKPAAQTVIEELSSYEESQQTENLINLLEKYA